MKKNDIKKESKRRSFPAKVKAPDGAQSAAERRSAEAELRVC
jgi:hypothetical protein